MKERIILTTKEAHMIQAWEAEATANKVPFVLPSPHRELWDLEVPDEPDNTPDEQRMSAGYEMLMRDCSLDQVALQMSWKANSQPLRKLAGLIRWMKKDK